MAAVGQARNGNLGRQGTIDIPLLLAMDWALQAADDMDEDALETATQEVFCRFNAIFYLSTSVTSAGFTMTHGPRTATPWGSTRWRH